MKVTKQTAGLVIRVMLNEKLVPDGLLAERGIRLSDLEKKRKTKNPVLNGITFV